jgi:hypothetical protein
MAIILQNLTIRCGRFRTLSFKIPSQEKSDSTYNNRYGGIGNVKYNLKEFSGNHYFYKRVFTKIMTKPYLFILSSIVILPMFALAQIRPDLSPYVGKKILSIEKVRNFPIDSTSSESPILDSTENITQAVYWTSKIEGDENASTFNTKSTRTIVYYKEGPAIIFDSDNPNKSTKIDTLYFELWKAYLNISARENIQFLNMTPFYQIHPFDTLTYNNLFFYQDRRQILQEKDTWINKDSDQYSQVADTFTVKKIYNNRIVIGFKNKFTVDPKVFNEMNITNRDSAIVNNYNTGNYIIGEIVFDAKTWFIYSIDETLIVTTGVEVNGQRRKSANISSKLSISNTVEQ